MTAVTATVLDPTFTNHARERIIEMGLRTKDIKHALRDVETTYPGLKRYGPGRRVAVSGKLAIVYQPGDRPHVITVLWNKREARHAG